MRRALLLRAGAVAFAAAIIGLWQILAEANVFSPVFLPAPTRTFDALAAVVQRDAWWQSLAATCIRMLYGWGLASIVGILLGAAIARSAACRAYLDPMLQFLRPLPASVFIPPAILFLGLTTQMVVTVIALGAVWPVLLGSYQGFRSVDSRLDEVASVLEMRPLPFLWKMALPSALADIFAGVRVSLAIALILAVVTEMQASQPGLGFNLMMAQRSFRSPDLYAGIVVLGALGFITNQVLGMAESYLLRWRRMSH